MARGRIWLSAVLAAGAVGVACSSFSGSDPDAPATTADAGSKDASLSLTNPVLDNDATVDEPEDEDGGVAPVEDDPLNDSGVLDAGPNCETIIAPTETFSVPSAAGAKVCNQDNVLAVDNRYTGLDLTTPTAAKVDNETIATCLGVSFPSEVSAIYIRMRTSPDACGSPCVGADCGTGATVKMFGGASPSALKYVNRAVAIRETRTFEVPIAAGASAKHFAACRSAFRPTQDDIELESIRGCARTK